jgi:hypothetical protein
MSNLIRRWIPVGIAILTGAAVLLGYWVPGYLNLPYRGRMVALHDILVEWAVIVAAFALLLGLFNIIRVHGEKILRRQPGRAYSLVLAIAVLVGMIPGILDPKTALQATLNHIVFDYIIGPLGASLAALVVFTLTLAAFRLLRTRRSLGAMIFWVIVVVILLCSIPPVGLVGWRIADFMAKIREWIITVPGLAGMRGLLLGVALGTIITALRVFLASERPYSES